jgi:hypothetical protein
MMLRTAAVALLLAAIGFTVHAAPPTQAAAAAPPMMGEVLETQNVDGYTYLRLKTAQQGEVWAAVPTTTVKKGAQVTIGNPMTMHDFESRTLKKKFDTIVFGQIVEPGAKAASPHGAAPAASAGAPPVMVAKVPKATGPDAKTVAEVVTGKAKLKDKTVVVRGQVVKVNLGIMGKNWVHLRDGSGSAAAGTHDILVTTKDTAAVGDIVNAKGIVRTDVTVGPGYAYAVLIEDAAVRK